VRPVGRLVTPQLVLVVVELLLQGLGLRRDRGQGRAALRQLGLQLCQRQLQLRPLRLQRREMFLL